MWPGLGCGPRDTLMVIIGKRFPKAPIGFIKFCMELVVLLIGVLLGAPFGLGTVLSWCVLPFILPDLGKLAPALILARRIAPALKR